MVLEQYMASGRAGPSGPTVHVHVVEGSCTERDPATAPGNQQLKDSDTVLQIIQILRHHYYYYFLINYAFKE